MKLGLSKSILIKAIEYALTSFFLYQANKSLVILYKPNADFAFYPLNRASIDSSTSNADCTGSICIYLSIKYVIAMLCFLFRSGIRLSILQRYHGHGEALYALFPQKLYHIFKQFLSYKYCLFLQFCIEILTKFRVKQHLKALY